MSREQVVPLAAEETDIQGLWIIRMKQVIDERGTVREFYRESAFRDAGLPSLGPWVQVNITETCQGAIRGLHGEQMTKLVAVAEGEAFGAYVDARPNSPSHGKTVTVSLTKGTQVLVPAGVCNGFQSVSPDGTQYLYCFDSEWVRGMGGMAINPLDPDLAIPWPLAVDPGDATQLSEKDAALPGLSDLASQLRLMRRPGLDNDRLCEMIRRSPWLLRVLATVRGTALPDAWVGAGVVRDLVWGQLYGDGFAPADVRDIDVAFFDPHDLSRDRDERATQELRAAWPEVPWEAKNQAAVHTWYAGKFGGEPVAPLHSVAEAVATWPETATAVAVRLDPGGEVEVCAPLGLTDLMAGVWRRNPSRVSLDGSLARLARHRPAERWPGVRVVLPTVEKRAPG